MRVECSQHKNRPTGNKYQEVIMNWNEYAKKLAYQIKYTGINNKAHYAKLFVAFMSVKK